jgi:hypothetical protein
MLIVNIIPAPHSKKAVWYDPQDDHIVIATADVIGLVELENPDNAQEIATIPMYMTADKLGVYTLPQLDVNFLEFLDGNDSVDIGKHVKQIEEIKQLYKKTRTEVVEVEKTGNVTQIKRIIKNVKTEAPKHDN